MTVVKGNRRYKACDNVGMKITPAICLMLAAGLALPTITYSKPKPTTKAPVKPKSVAKPPAGKSVKPAPDKPLEEAPEKPKGLSEEQRQAATKALRSLRKLVASREARLKEDAFAELLVEAKVDVAEAVDVLPEGNLLDSLQRALLAYQELVLTEKLLKGEASALNAYRCVEPMLTRYRLDVPPEPDKELLMLDWEVEDIYVHQPLRALWGHASQRVQAVAKSLSEE